MLSWWLQICNEKHDCKLGVGNGGIELKELVGIKESMNSIIFKEWICNVNP